MTSIIGTRDGVWVYNNPKGNYTCNNLLKCMWCEQKFKINDHVIDAMFKSRDGNQWSNQWSGYYIHFKCDEERDKATKKQIKIDRVYKMLH